MAPLTPRADPAAMPAEADVEQGLEATAAVAQSEMQRLIELGGLQHDPLRHPIRALSVHLDAFTAQARSVIEALERVIAAQKPPMTVADIKALTRAAGITAGNEVIYAIDRAILHRLRWWFVGAAAGLVLAIGVGFAAGWWWRGDVPLIAGVSAGSEHCDDRPDGGRLCWIPVWERLPASRP